MSNIQNTPFEDPEQLTDLQMERFSLLKPLKFIITNGSFRHVGLANNVEVVISETNGPSICKPPLGA